MKPCKFSKDTEGFSFRDKKEHACSDEIETSGIISPKFFIRRHFNKYNWNIEIFPIRENLNARVVITVGFTSHDRTRSKTEAEYLVGKIRKNKLFHKSSTRMDRVVYSLHRSNWTITFEGANDLEIWWEAFSSLCQDKDEYDFYRRFWASVYMTLQRMCNKYDELHKATGFIFGKGMHVHMDKPELNQQ